MHQATLVPSPVQQPHPPMYIAATLTRATLEFVVSTGHPLIIGVVLDTGDALALCRRFVEMSKAAGINVPMSRIPFSRYFYVAETEEQARRDTQAGLEWTVDMIQWRRTFARGSEVHHRLPTGVRRAPSIPELRSSLRAPCHYRHARNVRGENQSPPARGHRLFYLQLCLRWSGPPEGVTLHGLVCQGGYAPFG